MCSSEFPLRWESTGDQWWYASPIDFAAANGLYDVVRELLHLDTNLLIKLTSLRRIRRLETVWDDEAETQSQNLAKNRSLVAKNLLYECETEKGRNSLIRAGYGGWLLYTAASAGDECFVRELLGRDPFLVFGEGEYGVTDILYAGARSKSCEVFRVLFDFAVSPKGLLALGNGGEIEGELDEKVKVFKWEMKNRAVHALARGGNLEMLKEVLEGCPDVLVYKDSHGSSILHSAAGRGQSEVVKALIESYDHITTSRDNHGNTALHVAAYRGHLSVVEVLILKCPALISLSNNNGETYLHMAMAGFFSPGFRRLDRQLDLIKQLTLRKSGNINDIINVKNKDGRTALHMAALGNVKSEAMKLLMTVPSIDLNIRDADGMTPLDLLRRQPSSVSSEILIKQLISAGGVSSGQDYQKRTALVSRPRLQGIGRSPGTSFRISDAEIFLYTGLDAAPTCDPVSPGNSSSASELSEVDSTVSYDTKTGTFGHAARRLKFLLRWPRKKRRETTYTDSGDDESLQSVSVCNNPLMSPISLRKRFAKSPYSPNKNAALFTSSFPSPSAKRKFAAGLTQGVLQPTQSHNIPPRPPPSPFSEASVSPRGLAGKLKNVAISGPSCSTHQSFDEKPAEVDHEPASLNKKLMNHYFSFGAKHLGVEDSLAYAQPYLSHRRVGSLVA